MVPLIYIPPIWNTKMNSSSSKQSGVCVEAIQCWNEGTTFDFDDVFFLYVPSATARFLDHWTIFFARYLELPRCMSQKLSPNDKWNDPSAPRVRQLARLIPIWIWLWGFLKWGYPYIIHFRLGFSWIFPYKPSGYWGFPIYGNLYVDLTMLWYVQDHVNLMWLDEKICRKPIGACL
jgi:hypothetical protein